MGSRWSCVSRPTRRDARSATSTVLNSSCLNIPINQAEFTGTKLTFGMAVGAKYTGELAADKLTGEWAQPGLPQPLPLVLTREK